MNISNLTMEEKIGQLFLIGMPGPEVDPITKYLIVNSKIGGIILYRKNIVDENQLISLVNELKELNKNNAVPLFISVDEEGGRVNRMPKIVDNLISSKKISDKGGKDICYKSGQVLAEQLKLFGINLNFAPVLDIGGFEDNHAIGDRCYGFNAEEVSENGIATMKGIMDSGIISVVKHFPGHGASKRDSHIFIPVINKNLDVLEEEDLDPFKIAIAEGSECIMVGHLIISKLNYIYPASLSYKVITGILREKLGFKGLVITDDLSMRGINLVFGIKSSAIKAIKAGADIVMINKKHKSKVKIIGSINRLVAVGKIDETIINEKVEKILELKTKYNINDNKVELGNIEEINRMTRKINEEVNNI